MQNLGGRVASGILWAGGAVALQRATNLVVNILLARNLEPADFAVVVIATALTGFVGLFGEAGMAAAIIQRKDLAERHRSSAFWANTAFACVLALAVALFAPFSTFLSEDPRLPSVLAVISVQFLITGPSGVHQALLWRDLKVATLSKIQTVAVIVSGATALIVVYSGGGMWSIVVLGLVNRVIVATLYWWSSNWRPKFQFDFDAAKELFSFGFYLTLTKSATYATRNVDNIVIGKYLGGTALGYYSRAYVFVLAPIIAISQIVGRVMFPALSRIQDDVARVRQMSVKAMGIIALLVCPAMLGLATVSDSFVLVLLGERWSPMAPVLTILCPAAMWGALSTIVQSIYDSQGKTKLRFRVGLVADSLVVAGILVGIPWGVLGVSLGFSIGSLCGFLIHLNVAGRLVQLSLRAAARALLPIFGCAILMALLVHYAPRPSSQAGTLFAQIAVGVGAYGAMIGIIKPQALRDLLEIRQRRRTRS